MSAEDTPQHQRMLDAAVQWLDEIDIVLVAHGTLPDQLACEADPGTLLREFAINGSSVIALVTAVAPYMECKRSGALAVITSVAGDRGRRSNYVYGSAKAAVSVFREGLRAKLFEAGVSLTDIRPGFVSTRMTQGLTLPALMVSQPERVAKSIVEGIDKRIAVLYVPGFWRWIMFVIRHIPNGVFNRLKL